jgi:hypothetical protein
MRIVLVLLASALAAGGLCACDRQSETPGQKLDKALDKAGDSIKDAGEAIKPK